MGPKELLRDTSAWHRVTHQDIQFCSPKEKWHRLQPWDRTHSHKTWKIAIEFFCTSHFLQSEREGNNLKEKKKQWRLTNEKQTFWTVWGELCHSQNAHAQNAYVNLNSMLRKLFKACKATCNMTNRSKMPGYIQLAELETPFHVWCIFPMKVIWIQSKSELQNSTSMSAKAEVLNLM